MNILIGGASTYNGVTSLKDDEYFKTLGFNVRILDKNIDKAFSLINEIFKNTIFDNKEKVKSFILEFLYKCSLDILKEPKQYSIKRAKSYICKKSLYLESIEGIEYYNWLKNLCKDIDKNLDDIIEKLLYIKDNILNINGTYFGLACNDSIKNKCIKNIENLTFFNNNKTENITLDENLEIKNEAFYINTDVNYNTKVALLNTKNTGYLSILKRIIQSDYMWYKIRTEGGAYGGDISITDTGLMALTSYSDPNILKTYNSFNEIYSYIENLDITEEELLMYKIGTINVIDKPIKNYEINQLAMVRYFKQTDENELYIRKQQVLNATLDDIKKYSQIIKGGFKKSAICTIGNKDDISLCEYIFYSVKKIN